MKKIFQYILIFSLLLCSSIITAQYLANPSFEGELILHQSPPGWFGCGEFSTPDTQPGFSFVELEPSDSLSYLSLRTRGKISDTVYAELQNTVESCQTKLLQPFKQNYCYSVLVDLAYDSLITHLLDTIQSYPPKLRIWGCVDSCAPVELLEETDTITNTTWETYSLYLTPHNNSYNYIYLEPCFVGDTGYHSMLLIDNMRITEIDQTISLVMDTFIYIDENIVLTASDNSTYNWHPDSSLSCNGCQNPVASPVDLTTYYVDLYKLSGCVYKEKFTIDVIDCEQRKIENSYIKLDTFIKANDTIMLEASESISYDWNPKQNISCLNCKVIYANPGDSITYNVTLKDEYECEYIESFIIDMPDCEQRAIDLSYIKLDTLINPARSIQLDASNSISYDWNPKHSLSCYDCQSPIANVSEPDTFYANIKDIYECDYWEAFVIRLVDCEQRKTENSKHILDTIIDESVTIELIADNSIFYDWNPKQDLSCYNCQNTYATVKDPITYICTLYDEYECEYEESFTIDINLKIPNVITPNGDGINDYLKIFGLKENSTLIIFDRNGNVVYKNENYNNNWNGTDNNHQKLETGNYWYVFTNSDNNTEHKGYVFIKR